LTTTGKQIMQAVKNDGGIDPNWATAQQRAMEQYLERDLTDALQDLIDEPASAELIVQAQFEHNRRFLATDMPRKMIQASMPGDPMTDQRVAAVEGMIQKVVDSLADVLQDFDQLLQQSGLQERDYLLTLPLKPGVTQQILNRQITIGELLVDQPKIILGFSGN